MQRAVPYVLVGATLLVAGVLGGRMLGSPAPAESPAPVAAPDASSAAFFSNSPFQPLPLEVPLDGRKVMLGEKLFHEPRLSVDGTISCASCHDLARGGVDNQRYSVGVGGVTGQINTPTVLNGGFNFRQFWDGRAETLEQQVDGPLLHPAEMASNWDDVLALLAGDAAYAGLFERIYTDDVTADNVRDAIATFERSLITPNSRFDRFLRGDADALGEQEKEGYKLFVEAGCVTCHQGVNVGGNMFQALGKMGDYFADRGEPTAADLGRFNVTGDDRDLHKFKVPSLRNVELTAPYLHDGSAATLERAIQVMARYQIGQELHDDEVADLVAFLRTLTGEGAIRP